ncbi:hypothetical protein E3J84_01965 [Candidatus Aerophobetes bacterium]|uniref:Uncharacterized protein n=1 Tax=Aerophobetes bacterium TaxID=2030807 RepID=A0A523S2F8_UNCAE|nr:MAG: hypothetical protein E3J84_01965 [Candidatus Aerophobetes bacterium]
MKKNVYDITKAFLKEKYNISEAKVDEIRKSLNIPVEVTWLGGKEERRGKEDARNKKDAEEIGKIFKGVIKITGIIATATLLTVFKDYIAGLPVEKITLMMAILMYLQGEMKKLHD